MSARGRHRKWPHLDMVLRVQGTRVRVIERPGLWMPGAELAALRDGMHELVQRSIGARLDYGFVGGEPGSAERAVITTIVEPESGDVIAFNVLSFMDVDVRGQPTQALHLGLVMVDPERRTKGLSWVLYGFTTILMFIRSGMRPLWVSNVTQVPAIVGKVAEAIATAFPNPFAPARPSFTHVTVARQIMRRHRHVFGVGDEAGFDERRFVITNAYTGGSDNLKKSFDEAQHHRDERVNDLCKRELDYRRGDDFLQLAVFDLSTAQRYLLREVPRNSLPAVLGTLGFTLVGVLVQPLVRWLSPASAMGVLRPRRRRSGADHA